MSLLFLVQGWILSGHIHIPLHSLHNLATVQYTKPNFFDLLDWVSLALKKENTRKQSVTLITGWSSLLMFVSLPTFGSFSPSPYLEPQTHSCLGRVYETIGGQRLGPEYKRKDLSNLECFVSTTVCYIGIRTFLILTKISQL